jgi:2,3-dihydroxybiphenyl 1,2-dioxygenase
MTGSFQLGYLCLEVSDLRGFSNFATSVVGLTPGVPSDGWASFRLDGAAARLFCREGPADDIVSSGWDMGDEASLVAAIERLTQAGAAVDADVAPLARLRQVDRVAATADFHGTGVELFVGQHQSTDPLDTGLVPGGFLSGDGMGFGHFVLVSRDKQRDIEFYRDALGLRWSDDIVMPLGPFGNLDATFLHANPRHHSLAVGAIPEPVPLSGRLDHICLEVNDLDDVGFAHQRFVGAGLKIVRDFGKHPNDGAFSFYGRTPSKFDVEIAFGSVLIDDESWSPQTYSNITKWGHRSSQEGPAVGGAI